VDKDRAEFEEAIQEKLINKHFDFRGIYFPGSAHLASFLPYATFEGTANFSQVTFEESAFFSNATFEGEASFSNATFEGRASFSDATFMERGDFIRATFKERADFQGATFKERADFQGATFKESAFFSNATFEESASFSDATFMERGRFWYLQTFPQTFLSLREAVIEKPERFSFHSTLLRPSWFMDVDARKFDFSNVEWFRLPGGDELKLEEEIESLARRGPMHPTKLRMLQKACRRLMDNAEENRDYATANEFHYWSMVLARKEALLLAREKSFREALRRFGLIDALYGALSGYGERPRRAFLVLVGMGTLFAILYVMVAGSIEHVGQAFLYSLAAMVRLTGVPAMAPLTKLLQPSEPGLFQLLVTAEGILGPLQIALLALAVRRRVMR